MPCNLTTICYIDQHNEVARKSSFVVNAVGIVNSRHQNINIYVHIIAFYQKDVSRDNDLERFNKGDIIQVQGKFSVIETEVDESKVKLIKVWIYIKFFLIYQPYSNFISPFFDIKKILLFFFKIKRL